MEQWPVGEKGKVAHSIVLSQYICSSIHTQGMGKSTKTAFSHRAGKLILLSTYKSQRNGWYG